MFQLVAVVVIKHRNVELRDAIVVVLLGLRNFDRKSYRKDGELLELQSQSLGGGIRNSQGIGVEASKLLFPNFR